MKTSNGFLYYSKREIILRILWSLINPLWKFSPRYLWFWRRWLIRLFGGKIDYNVKIYPSAKIVQPWNIKIKKDTIISWNVTVYAVGKINIGKNVIISQGAHLCSASHDFKKKSFDLIKSFIEVDDNTWIAAEAFIGDGVRLGKNSIIGARSVVFSDVLENEIVIGNPAKYLKKR